MENNNQQNVIELERALLGAVFVNENLFHNIKGFLTHEDFYDVRNAILFQAISSIYEKGLEAIEIAPVIDELKKNNQLEKVGGQEFIATLINEAGLETNIQYYIKAIADKADLRRVKNQFTKISKELDNPQASASDALEKMELEILSNVRGMSVKEFISSKEGVNEAINDLEKRMAGEVISGISVDLPSLDEKTGGFQRGDLVILAARPSMGKTALALNMAANAAKKKRVAFFSLEMPSVQLFNRILSFTAFIDGHKFRDPRQMTDTERKKLYLAKEQIEKMNIFIDDTPGIKLSELIWKAKKLHKNKGIDIIFIDYLQLIVASNSSNSDNRQAEVSIISSSLKKLARELNVPVIALSQLSRKVEQRESKVPMMSDLRESGAIEQDADLIAFVYRDAYYNREKYENAEDTKEVADVIISKHRNGATGTVKLVFRPEHSLFLEEGNR